MQKSHLILFLISKPPVCVAAASRPQCSTRLQNRKLKNGRTVVICNIKARTPLITHNVQFCVLGVDAVTAETKTRARCSHLGRSDLGSALSAQNLTLLLTLLVLRSRVQSDPRSAVICHWVGFSCICSTLSRPSPSFCGSTPPPLPPLPPLPL